VKISFTVSVVVAASLLTGCAVGPDYHRPAVQTPSAFRAPTPQPTPEAASLADLKWWEVFKDEKLQALIRTSLVENYDLRDAVVRVEAARANLGITRSEQFPNAEVGGALTTTRLSRNGQLPLPVSFVP
jgi:outer membrane protein, multidrug efflux system